MQKRPPWDDYFLNLAHVVKSRANCLRLSVGVVIVKDKRIIATGYNGTPTGVKNCLEGGCQRCLDRQNNVLKENERKDLCICLHAEENALLQSAYHGVSTKDAVLYSTIAPCLQCAKSIINSGIAKVVYASNHQDDLGVKLLVSAGIAVVGRLLFLLLMMLFAADVSAQDLKSISNNKYGIHLAQPNYEDIKATADLVNSNGGKWGYITLVIQENDRDLNKWQGIFDYLRELRLIPIIRIATKPEGDKWRKPNPEDAAEWLEFLNNLNWVVKNRYVILFNEPNHGREWGGRVDPASYNEVTLEFMRQLKEKNSDFFLMLAGFDASAPSSAPLYEDEEKFLSKVMDNITLDLWEKYLSGWASHSYPASFVGTVQGRGRKSVRTYEWELQLLQRLGLKKALPVFITETGWLNNLKGVQDNYKTVFESVWLPDNRVVAVTPFLLNYQGQPFDIFSWILPERAGFYPQYDLVKSLAKIAGKPEIQDRGIIYFDLPRELVVSSSYRFEVDIKNTGQAIWDKSEGYNLKINSGETYFFGDIKNIYPQKEEGIDLYFKTDNQTGEKDLTVFLQKNDQILTRRRWKFNVLPLPKVYFTVDLYPKLKKTSGSDFELQIFDEKEQLVYKKKKISVKDGEGFLDNIQNISYGKKYRLVLLNQYYLPRQKYLIFFKDRNIVSFDKMYPLDFNADGMFNLKDLWALIINPQLIVLLMP